MAFDFDISTAANTWNVTGGSFDPDVSKRVFFLTGGEFDLLSLARTVFGYTGIPLAKIETGIKMNEGSEFEEGAIRTFDAVSPSITSALGTPIYQPLKMIDPGHPITGAKIEPYQFQNEPMITITGQKRLIETPSAGGTQEIIEHIATGHYELRIAGVLVNMETDDLPEADIRKMRSYYELRRSVRIENPLLSYFNINLFAFKSIDFQPFEGHQSIQTYTIIGRSDKVYTLVRKAKNTL